MWVSIATINRVQVYMFEKILFNIFFNLGSELNSIFYWPFLKNIRLNIIETNLKMSEAADKTTESPLVALEKESEAFKKEVRF